MHNRAYPPRQKDKVKIYIKPMGNGYLATIPCLGWGFRGYGETVDKALESLALVIDLPPRLSQRWHLGTSLVVTTHMYQFTLD